MVPVPIIAQALIYCTGYYKTQASTRHGLSIRAFGHNCFGDQFRVSAYLKPTHAQVFLFLIRSHGLVGVAVNLGNSLQKEQLS